MAKVLVVAGSLRADALSKKFARAAAQRLAALGLEVDLLDLRDVEMPPYDGDLEEASGLPPGAVAFKARLGAADALFLVTPEYNHSIPGTFKNAIDWASRGDDDVFDGKVMALAATSPGGVGGMRALAHLRDVMFGLGGWLLPVQVTVSKAHEAFDATGALTHAFYGKQLDAMCAALSKELS